MTSLLDLSLNFTIANLAILTEIMPTINPIVKLNNVVLPASKYVISAVTDAVKTLDSNTIIAIIPISI